MDGGKVGCYRKDSSPSLCPEPSHPDPGRIRASRLVTPGGGGGGDGLGQGCLETSERGRGWVGGCLYWAVCTLWDAPPHSSIGSQLILPG